MRRAVLAFLAVTGCLAACEPGPRSSSEERAGGIVGGFEVKQADVSSEGAASAVVAIEATLDDGLSLCTGTLIGPRLVLTAAHCLAEVSDAGQLSVALHALDLRRAPPPSVLFYPVVRFQIHPGYQPESVKTDQHFDLALLALDRPVPQAVKLAILPTAGFDILTSRKLVTFGYGIADDRLNATDDGVRVLRTTSYAEGTFGILPLTTVPAGLPGVDKYQGMIGSLAALTSVCDGDSGGPLFAVTGEGVVLAGVNDLVIPSYTGQRGRDFALAVKNHTLQAFAKKYPDTRTCMGGWNVFVNLEPQLAWITNAGQTLLAQP